MSYLFSHLVPSSGKPPPHPQTVNQGPQIFSQLKIGM